jgi:hypothetical protein
MITLTDVRIDDETNMAGAARRVSATLQYRGSRKVGRHHTGIVTRMVTAYAGQEIDGYGNQRRVAWLRIGCTRRALVWWATNPAAAKFITAHGGLSRVKLNAMRYGFVCTVAMLLGVEPPQPKRRR